MKIRKLADGAVYIRTTTTPATDTEGTRISAKADGGAKISRAWDYRLSGDQHEHIALELLEKLGMIGTVVLDGETTRGYRFKVVPAAPQATLGAEGREEGDWFAVMCAKKGMKPLAPTTAERVQVGQYLFTATGDPREVTKRAQRGGLVYLTYQDGWRDRFSVGQPVMFVAERAA